MSCPTAKQASRGSACGSRSLMVPVKPHRFSRMAGASARMRTLHPGEGEESGGPTCHQTAASLHLRCTQQEAPCLDRPACSSPALVAGPPIVRHDKEVVRPAAALPVGPLRADVLHHALRVHAAHQAPPLPGGHEEEVRRSGVRRAVGRVEQPLQHLHKGQPTRTSVFWGRTARRDVCTSRVQDSNRTRSQYQLNSLHRRELPCLGLCCGGAHAV
jgi:hypothetical protein